MFKLAIRQAHAELCDRDLMQVSKVGKDGRQNSARAEKISKRLDRRLG
jgi:hypothetical protein